MTVKDNSFIGGGIFLGEALLKLEDIPLSQIDQNLSELPQMQLPLTKPSYQGAYIYSTASANDTLYHDNMFLLNTLMNFVFHFRFRYYVGTRFTSF